MERLHVVDFLYSDFGAGCHLVDLKDKFWNTEKLVEVLGTADGITVATALYALADLI